MTHVPNRRSVLSCTLIFLPLAAGLTACSEDGSPFAAAPYDATDQIAVNLEGDGDGGTADYREPLEVTTTSGESRITDVIASDGAGRRLRGRLSADGTRWRSTGPLAAGVRYTVLVSTEKAGGAPGRRTVRFETRPADGRKLGVTFGPEKGTYGVGQPLVAELSHRMRSLAERRTVERALLVDSAPKAEGAWHWADSKTLHYRPKEYWPAHSTITLRSGLRGVRIREGLIGGATKPLTIRTGDRVEALVDIGAYRMTVWRNGERLRTVPVTTGKPGFRTRSGVKVVLGKQRFIRMQGTSIGIPEGSSESYDLPVYWNTQITRSGEFAHGAPWSAGSHGAANVSHGCTGMSSDNARWFYQLAQRGDIVKYVNGEGERMPAFGNGFGDWNLSWKDWKNGSALRQDLPTRRAGGETARLRFEL